MSRKRTITIKFEFSNKYDHEDFEASLDGLINDFMDDKMSSSLDYEVLERTNADISTTSRLRRNREGARQ